MKENYIEVGKLLKERLIINSEKELIIDSESEHLLKNYLLTGVEFIEVIDYLIKGEMLSPVKGFVSEEDFNKLDTDYTELEEKYKNLLEGEEYNKNEISELEKKLKQIKRLVTPPFNQNPIDEINRIL